MLSVVERAVEEVDLSCEEGREGERSVGSEGRGRWRRLWL